MSVLQRGQHRFLVVAILTIILSAFPLSLAPASPVQAETVAADEDPILEDELVYIGSEDERIRVLDPHQVGTKPLVQWISPDGGWRAFDLGDFNADGDMEIVAIRGGGTASGELGELTIYDPYVATGTSGLPTINGIAWQVLHSRPIPGRPTLVKAGNFDPNLPGDEIVYGFLVNDDVPVDDEGDKYRFTIIKSSIPNPDGSNWMDHISAKDEGVEWDGITSGDMGDGGADEIILLEEDGGEINVFKIGSGWQRIFDDGNDDRPYRSAAIGDYYRGGYKELIASRKASPSLATLFYYLFTPGSSDGLNFHAGIENEEKIQPYPRYVFVSDVNGSGDDEVFFLRREQGPRLVGRNHGDDPMPSLEQALDGDDGYRVGAGGDFDGNGNGDVAVLRNNKLLIFSIENGAWVRNEYGVSADTNYLLAGDIDAAGVARGPQWALKDIDPALIAGTLEPNREGPSVRYDLINAGGDDALFFTWAESPATDWVDISFDKTVASAASPAGIFVKFDSADLLPGTYTTDLIITGNNPDITNNPFTIPVKLTVEPARLNPSPTSASFIYFPCENVTGNRVQKITLNGTTGVKYNAALIEQPQLEALTATLSGDILDVRFAADGQATFRDGLGNEATIQLPAAAEVSASAATIDWPGTSTWVTARSETGVVPDVITISVDGAAISATYQEAVLVIVGDPTAGNNPTNVRLVGISSLCAASQTYLPYLRVR